MRLLVIALILLPNLLFAQGNELYKLLKWDNPKQQQQLIAWYDLQDASTIKKNNSNPGNIFGIDDKGIGKNHITQPKINNQPILIKDDGFSNGPKNGVSFSNGGYMVYKFPKEKSVNSITSFVVCKNDIGGSKLLYDLSKEGGEGIASCYSGLYKIESRVPNSLADFEPDYTNNQSKYLLISTKGKSGKINSYLNSSNYSGSGSRNFQGTSYNQIRLSTEKGVAETDGTLYELILFDSELSDDEFYLVKKYLENKYQVNTNTSINNQNSNTTYRSSLIEGRGNSGISNNSTDVNDPEINKKEFAKLLARFESTNSTNSKFSGDIQSYPSNPSDSYYKKDYYNNQLIYEGYMKEIINSSNGNTVYKQQLKYGRGKEYFINSSGSQEGFFVNGKLEGYGEHISSAYGFSYKGYFNYGVRSGEGILVMDGINGTTKYIYEGSFLNGKYNGKGTLTYNFMSYTGNFENDMMNGKGVNLYPNGDKYVGNFVNGRWEGYGEYYWANGNFYKGEFSNNLRNGNGELTFANGTNQKGIFENGNYIGVKKIVETPAPVYVSNATEEYSLENLKYQDCDIIKSEFKKFAINYINYRKRVKANPYSLRIREDTDWENNLRKFSDLVSGCAIKLKGAYAAEVLGYYDKISALLPIEPKISSSSNTKSYDQNKSNSYRSQTTQSNNNNSNNVEKKVDLSNEVLSQIVSCKTCGNPVTIQRNVPRSPEFKKSFNESGGITSSMCQKCNKTSTYTYEIRNAQFVKVN